MCFYYSKGYAHFFCEMSLVMSTSINIAIKISIQGFAQRNDCTLTYYSTVNYMSKSYCERYSSIYNMTKFHNEKAPILRFCNLFILIMRHRIRLLIRSHFD